MWYYFVMDDSLTTTKIKEIQAQFLEKVKLLEKMRDEKIISIKKGIDQRKIDALLKKIKE